MVDNNKVEKEFVDVEVEFDSYEQIGRIAIMAHEKDMTFNDFCCFALNSAIEKGVRNDK